MGKVKVVSKNNQVSVKVKSTKDEQLNQNMAELLSNTAVEGFLPFHIVSDNNGFTAEYGTAGYETAKEFFKNRVIDQHTFFVFMKSSVNALSGMSAYNMEYGNVMVSLDTVLIESATGKALYLYYPATGYNNGEFYNVFLDEILRMIRTPMNSDVSFMVRLKELLKQPENMTWNILGEYADSIDVPAVNRENMQPQVHVVQTQQPETVQFTHQAPPVMYTAPVQMQTDIQNTGCVSGGDDKICPVCGMRSTTPDAVFCIGCGSRLESAMQFSVKNEQTEIKKRCNKCGFSNNSDALFCSECGTKLEDIGVLESTEIQDNDDNNAKDTSVIIIKGGRVVDPVSKTDEIMDIIIKNNIIEETGYNLNVMEGAEVINAEGLIVAPGLMDTHVHFRDPGFTYKEDIITGAAAAAKGGFTSVVCMANTKPAVDNIETLEYIQKKGETTGIHVLQTASVTKELKGVELVDMEALANAGAVGFTDDGIPLMDEKLVEEAMKKAKELDVPISLHEEDPAYIKQPGVNQGKVSEQLNYGGASYLAEAVMVKRDCELAVKTGAKVDIQHISSGVAVDYVKEAKEKGANVYAEASPHHFTLTEEAVLKYGTLARMNPPLRTEEDRQRIIKGLQEGTIEIIATDHAPHSKEEKDKPLDQAPSGITGIETSLALGVTELVEKGYLSMMQLLEKMTINPAKLYNMEQGRLQEGKPADVVLFDPEEEWEVKEYKSKATNSPFTGWKLKGKVKYTICDGKIIEL